MGGCVCSGWWLVENEDKRMAWFPAPYLEKLDEDEDDGGDDIDGTSDRGTCMNTALDQHLIPSVLMLWHHVLKVIYPPLRNTVHRSEELQGHKKWWDKRDHRCSGGAPAENWKRLVAHQVFNTFHFNIIAGSFYQLTCGKMCFHLEEKTLKVVI